MSGGSLQAIYIELTTSLSNSASFLQQKWGKASSQKKVVGELEYHWLNAEKGIGLKLDKQSNLSQLSYYQYIPIQTLFPQNIPSLPKPIWQHRFSFGYLQPIGSQLVVLPPVLPETEPRFS